MNGPTELVVDIEREQLNALRRLSSGGRRIRTSVCASP
jgi:hypothetical protein